jgi:hypothetical protein
LGALLSVLILACSENTAPEPTFWDYSLVSVNGSAPYLSRSQLATESEELYAGTFGLLSDGTWSLSLTIFGVTGGQPITPSTPQRNPVFHGTWTRSKDTFTLRDNSDNSTMTAVHSKSQVTVTKGGDTLVFELNCYRGLCSIGF